MEIVEQALVLGELSVVPEGSLGDPLHRILVLRIHLEFRFVDGLERVNEDGGRQNFEIVLRRATVGELGRHDLTLLGDAHVAVDGAGRLRGDGAAGGRTTAAHRATAAVEEADRNARVTPDADQPPLCLEELEAGAEESAVLVGVGIAQHHFLPSAMRGNRSLHHRVGEQLGHDLRRGTQVVDGFEQGHHADAADFTRRLVREEPRELREEIEAQNVRCRLRHRQDEGADGMRVRAIDRVADQFEKVQQLARLVGDSAKLRQEAQRLRQLGFDPGLPFGTSRFRALARFQRVQLAPDFLQNAVDDRGVLADVEAHRAEAEGFHLPADGPHQRGGDGDGLHLRQRLLGGMELLDQFASVDGLEASALRLIREGFREAHLQRSEETPERLVGIAAADRFGIAGELNLRLDAIEEALREGNFLRGERDKLGQIVQPLLEPRHDGIAIFLQRIACHVHSHEGIAVAVASDPGGIAQRWANMVRRLGIVALQRCLKQVAQAHRAVEQGFTEEVQSPVDFLLHRRLLKADLAGEPEEVDLVPEQLQQLHALARRPARALELIELEIDAAVDFQHGHALGFRRVGGDGGLHVDGVESCLHGLGRDVGCGHGGEGMGEGPRHLVRPAAGFHLAAVAHRRVFLGDVEELQPHADDLQCGLDQFWGKRGGIRRFVDDGQNARLAHPDDLAQQVPQHHRGLIQIGMVHRTGAGRPCKCYVRHLMCAPQFPSKLVRCSTKRVNGIQAPWP